MSSYVSDLGPGSEPALVGGKGALLAELARIDGVRVPAAFAITTDAFRRVITEDPATSARIDRLSQADPDDRELIRELSAEIREAIERLPLPEPIAAPIVSAINELGASDAYAVRSSATAEDLPSASFAGQHDSFLNVEGVEAIVERVRQCWASLFTERAVTYRLRNGIDHRDVQMAVIVQRMVPAQAAGVLFTADPVTSNRKLVSIEAVRGLGEALVSGLAKPDLYKVHEDEVLDRTVAAREPVLTDAQILELNKLGRHIESHFAHPQDIEWCLAGDAFTFVQSRPITTLFPIPDAGDEDNHVYVSVGHQQMMTDAMKPLGLSFWLLTTPRQMHVAGGRLFVDVTRDLASAAGRASHIAALGRSDPLLGDALQTVYEREGFVPTLDDQDDPGRLAAASAATAQPPLEADPTLVTALIERTQASLAALKRDIDAHTGQARVDFIRADLQELRRLLTDPESMQVIMAAMQSSFWLNEHIESWLGERNVADTLAQSVPHNVTAEMGLALLDVADAIRPHAEVVAFLESVEADGLRNNGFLEDLPTLTGGQEARNAIQAFLVSYGMRCTGEIDITRPRWSESPATLVPLILSNVKNFEPGAAGRRFERGREEAAEKEQELLLLLRSLPDGEQKAAETKRMIDRVRTFSGYREFPKYGMVSRYCIHKQALLGEADRLVATGVLSDRTDIFFLTFEELEAVVRTRQADAELISRRRDEYSAYQALSPPRVLTSDGETIGGAYRRLNMNIPDDALDGLPVSAGTAEGRARVILDIAEADLEPDDILVTTYTDPSWTPLFVAIKGLVTEVGGLMTHGAVIAREYGIPAVVGVEHATDLIRDGQRIRVHGTEGYVEILS